MMNNMVLLLGGMRIKIESDYNYPVPPHVMEFVCNNNNEVDDLHIQILSNKKFHCNIGKIKYYDATWFSVYENAIGESIFLFEADEICNITHLWISKDKKSAKFFIDESFCSEQNISIIETTPFLMCFMNILLHNDGIILHSAGALSGKYGYIFCGKSGSGKTTLSNLLKRSGKYILITDESVIVRKQGSKFIIYGSPWKGSGDNIYSCQKGILECIYFIFHGKCNKHIPAKKRFVISNLIKQAFPYFWDKELMKKSLSLITSIANEIDCNILYFIPDNTAVDYISAKE